MATLVDERILVTSVEVWEELKKGGDDLYDWVNARKSKICVDYDEPTQLAMLDILSRYPKLVSDKAPGSFGADPHVIAVAQVHSCTIVTNERKKGPQAKKLGIPDVCEELGIPCINFLNFLRLQKWKYS